MSDAVANLMQRNEHWLHAMITQDRLNVMIEYERMIIRTGDGSIIGSPTVADVMLLVAYGHVQYEKLRGSN
jgi:hypothetical protein